VKNSPSAVIYIFGEGFISNISPETAIGFLFYSLLHFLKVCDTIKSKAKAIIASFDNKNLQNNAIIGESNEYLQKY
jgi:hypothetical protein